MKKLSKLAAIVAVSLFSQSAFAWHSYDYKVKKYLEDDIGAIAGGDSDVTSNKHGCHYAAQPYADKGRSCARFLLDGKDDALKVSTDQVHHYCDMIAMQDLACNYANEQYWLYLASILDTGSVWVAQEKENIFSEQVNQHKNKLVDEAKTADSEHAGELATKSEAKIDGCDGLGVVGEMSQGAYQWYCAIKKSNEMKAMRGSMGVASAEDLANLKDLLVPLNPNNPPPIGPSAISSGSSFVANGNTGLSDSAIAFLNAIPDSKPVGTNSVNAATEGGVKERSPAQKAFNAAANKFKKAGGDPELFMSELDQSGLAAAIEKSFGSKIPADTLAAMKAVDKLTSPEGIKALAAMSYESGKRASGSAKKDKSPLDFFADRNPAAVGGVKKVDYGSALTNDIWHSGTKLSIFEIVTKKTSDVASRVQ